jgi:hypothetical protein
MENETGFLQLVVMGAFVVGLALFALWADVRAASKK